MSDKGELNQLLAAVTTLKKQLANAEARISACRSDQRGMEGQEALDRLSRQAMNDLLTRRIKLLDAETARADLQAMSELQRWRPIMEVIDGEPIATMVKAGGNGYYLASEVDALLTAATACREALDRLSRLGNEPLFGNSEGNRIAQDALRAFEDKS